MWATLVIGVMAWMAPPSPEGPAEPPRFAERVEAQGLTRARLERAYDRLCSPPLDDLEFVLSDVHFHLTRRFTNYSGDVSGRMLGALQAAGPVIDRDTPMTRALAAAFSQCQKPDGHFGADQDLAAGVEQKRDMPILWGNGRLLLALAERYRQEPDPELLATAKRLGEYAIATRGYYGRKENFERVGGAYSSGYTTCYPSLIDGLAALGQISGDARFYDEAGFIAHLSLLDRVFEEHHSHGRLTAYRGMLDLDRFTGTREFLDVVRAGCRTITDDFLLPTGGVTEMFDRTHPRDEGCSEGDWIRVNFLLWQATGDMAYLDAAERALRNHLLATQFPNGGFGHHTWRALADGERSYPAGGIANVGTEAYWCCSMHGTQILADTARWGIFFSQNKVLVTWLAEVGSTFRLGEQRVRITSRQSNSNTWSLLLDSPRPAEAVLHLRVPGWADTISVDGKSYKGQGGWVEVPASWSGSLIMKVTFPPDIRLAGAYRPEPAPDAPVRVFAGADLFCLPDVCLGDEQPADDTVPTVVLAADTLPPDGEIPVVVERAGGRTQAARLVPMMHRPPGGCRFLFHVRRVDAEAFEKLLASAAAPPEPAPMVELTFACDGHCEIYLNGRRLYQSAGWSESARMEAPARPGSNVLVLKARSDMERPALIGALRAGRDLHVTSTDHWSAAPWPRHLPEEWLTEPDKALPESATLIDLGQFGSPPWNHVPGGFAGTDARWIWPDAPAEQAKQWWLLRYTFELPRPADR